jgi:transcription elongation factor GreA
MAETKIKTVSELLNEEKWTRATINNYTVNNFKELDEIIDEIIDSEEEDEIKQLCDEHLTHTKNSIIALYISGIVSLKKQLIDDSNLVMLINIFSDNHKWNIVEYLCNRILSFGENKFALRTLAESYSNENEDEKKYEIWERLIKVDYEEADIVRFIAEKKESENNIEDAVEYYKKAIHRYINKKLFSNVKEVWHKLIQYIPEEIDFFFHVETKVAKTISEERASQLLEDLYSYYKERENWDKAIEILKRILDYDSKNAWARQEIITCYQGKYKDHSHLDEYIKLSNLNQSWRNVYDAIADFEKHIAFDGGNFVCHRSWGIGRIAKIEDDEIVIDFARKRNHKMSLKMAVNALSTLSRDHIWVLKVIMKKGDLKEKIKKDIPWALNTIIRSFDNAADMKKIKAELVPSILTPSEWTSWSTQARKILKTDPNFGNLPDKPDQFVVRDNPISYEEKIFNKFKAEKSFFGRLQTTQDFLANSSPDSEYFAEMFDYFVGFLRSFNTVNEFVISSFLVVDKIVNDYPYLNPGLQIDFNQLMDQVSDITDIFLKIENSELKRSLLEQIKDNRSDWPDIFVKLFPNYLSKYILDELKTNKYDENIFNLITTIVENYKDYREAFIWLAKNFPDPSWFGKFDIKYEKILIGMIHLLDISYREINNRTNVGFNRKINKQIQTYLFKDKRLEDYFLVADEESISRIYSLIEDVKDLDPSIKLELKHTIMEKFPNFKFYGKEERGKVTRGLIVTPESYKRKQEALRHLIDVEVPENSKEIGTAMEKGDLRENAEYKAAKEKQEMLNSTVAKLKEEIEKAQIFDKNNVDTSTVSFGTKVTLKNKETEVEEEYTILGPWESDPSKNVISYLSPLGTALINHKEGEDLDFSINEREYSYKIEGIKEAQF